MTVTKIPSRQIPFVLALLAVALVLPYTVYPVFLMKGLCFGLFAAAFNLLLGYVGLLSFGHAMFFGWSAYVTAYAAKEWGLTPEIAILLGVALATALGAVVGWLAIRRQGIYFSMITLALAQLGFFVAVQAPMTHGEDGIQGVPRGHLFGLIDLANTMAMYYFVLAVFVVSLLFLHRVVNSPFGQVLKAIRDNEPRAISLGYEVSRYKLIAFVLSAAFAGLAGSLKSLVFQLASLADVNWHMSGEVVLMTLMGGVGTVLGPTVGAFLVVAIQDFFAGVGSWVIIIQGVIFVVCVLLFRSGMIGVLAPWLKRRGITG
ncbi:putative High-affinity branched-chain amino acid transport system permease protein livM [Magnetospirillum sp. XM-1]|uniref:branched-chain amino acid ABC transporter permease n=1 Tax=Magnetospirillum sp. XM-1 TaxID=1663591 RepID=UPI00073DDB76|nr:branched-chain amino acid ABC transporter permease [Magnetospirillum sp. XM-1]CUW40389.1 putative High-affinity branched-chain amino acid transport system permease protein livM [Magnetospirillum sp. XM-1]